MAQTISGASHRASRSKNKDRNATISEYMGWPSVDWVEKGTILMSELLKSGHSVEILSTEGPYRVSVGRYGSSISKTGDTVVEACINALVAFISFLEQCQRTHSRCNVLMSRDCLPFPTAIAWMLQGLSVRRSHWPAGSKLSIQLGEAQDRATQAYVDGIPLLFYRPYNPKNPDGHKPVFIFTDGGGATRVWECGTSCALAFNWEVIENES